MAQQTKKIIKLVLIFIFLLIFLFPTKVLAEACLDHGCVDINDCARQECITFCPQLCSITTSGFSLGNFKGLGPLGNPVATEQDPGASAFTNFITKTIGVMTVVAFIWFIFVLFTGAIGWLSSGGDKVKLQEAQKKITTGLIGLIIVISAIFLIKLIGNMFDIDILDLTTFITNLGK